MKTLVTTYTFDASAKTIAFGGYVTINLERVLLIVNATDNVIIYNFADATKGGTVATNVLTLTYDTAAMDDTDKLLIYYDDITATQAISASVLEARIGEIQASPTSNTVLDRLKQLLTGIVLSAGTAIIGKVGIDQTTPGTTNGVEVNAELPAGTNNIGDIDVLGGGVADNAADSGNPVKVGGKYNASTQTYADGDRCDDQHDVNGNKKVTMATGVAGEDLANDVLKTEQRFSGSVVTADSLVKSGAGFLHTLTFSCNDAAPTAGSIIVYDNTAESGTILYSETFDTTAFRGYTVLLDISFTTGLYIGFTTTNDINVTPSYR